MQTQQMIREYFLEFLKHYSPAALCRLTGIHYQQIYTLTRGQHNLGSQNIERLKANPQIRFEQWGKDGFDAAAWVRQLGAEQSRFLNAYSKDKTTAKAGKAQAEQTRNARLQAVREQAAAFAEQFSQYQICAITGIGSTSISYLIHGKAGLSDQNLQKIEQSIVMQPEKWHTLQKQKAAPKPRRTEKAAQRPKAKPTAPVIYSGSKIIREENQWTVYRLGYRKSKPFAKAVFRHPSLEDAQNFADQLAISSALPRRPRAKLPPPRR